MAKIKKNVLLTADAFDLVKNSFNLKHRYVVHVEKLEQVRMLMSLENQTIGFIANSFNEIFTVKRQMTIRTYRVDLCILEPKIVMSAMKEITLTETLITRARGNTTLRRWVLW